ncbi:BTB/POZ domain-containing protein At3g56230 [Nicotiana sylvestris]|uniref:BTB/POZ domain-containing protein At3g56230 n=1 Tax=Nicotiana sylvestris TaxID=4096 RepID=A0A1U7XUT0_NICSY|nr:PREDICTED: BTB/POZ domain-containing protein At3g56230 [Nicotiana sylvestris]
MDCSICSAMPFILRPPRNTICGACYEGARTIITLTNRNDHSDNTKGTDNKTVTGLSASSSNPSIKGFVNALKWVKEMKEMEEELNEKLNYLSRFVVAFRDHIHTDILIKPGNDGPSIPAHRALLAARSDIFKNILDSDGCKAPPSDTITLPELNYEELESLLEFLYSGDLSKEKMEKHVYSLSIAADKYEIPFLQKFCEHQMLGSLNSSNALDILEISDTCSNLSLKETSLNFIVKNMEDIVFTARFDAFALKNPHLTVQITRASFIDIKNKRLGV